MNHALMNNLMDKEPRLPQSPATRRAPSRRDFSAARALSHLARSRVDSLCLPRRFHADAGNRAIPIRGFH